MYAQNMIKLIDDDNEKASAILLTKEDEARIKKNSIKGKDEVAPTPPETVVKLAEPEGTATPSPAAQTPAPAPAPAPAAV